MITAGVLPRVNPKFLSEICKKSFQEDLLHIFQNYLELVRKLKYRFFHYLAANFKLIYKLEDTVNKET